LTDTNPPDAPGRIVPDEIKAVTVSGGDQNGIPLSHEFPARSFTIMRLKTE
jgi:hypothetical protein